MVSTRTDATIPSWELAATVAIHDNVVGVAKSAIVRPMVFAHQTDQTERCAVCVGKRRRSDSIEWWTLRFELGASTMPR